jgi:D-3-phosphoglycerate dehydrogenase
VVACDPAVSPGAGPAGVELDSLDGLLARCDVVTLHVPLVPATSGLIDARRLASMPEGAYLVNVARGGLVDLDALLAELDRGRLAGAALDVLPAEPPPAGAAVVRHPRVMLTPHVGFLSAEAVRDSATRQVENVLAWARGGRALDVVVEGAA